MPQLITIPYNHVYFTVVTILGISYFIFVKYLLANILFILKPMAYFLIYVIKNNIAYIQISGLLFIRMNIYSIYSNNVLYSVDMLFCQMVYCIYKEYKQFRYLCNYVTNYVSSKVSYNILLNNRFYENEII